MKGIFILTYLILKTFYVRRAEYLQWAQTFLSLLWSFGLHGFVLSETCGISPRRHLFSYSVASRDSDPFFILPTSFVLSSVSLRLDLIYLMQKWGIPNTSDICDLTVTSARHLYSLQTIFPPNASSHFSNSCLVHREPFILSICRWEFWKAEELHDVIKGVAEFRDTNYKRVIEERCHTLSSIYSYPNHIKIWLLSVMCWIVSPQNGEGLIPVSVNMTLFGNRAFVIDQIKMKSSGWGPNPH